MSADVSRYRKVRARADRARAREAVVKLLEAEINSVDIMKVGLFRSAELLAEKRKRDELKKAGLPLKRLTKLTRRQLRKALSAEKSGRIRASAVAVMCDPTRGAVRRRPVK